MNITVKNIIEQYPKLDIELPKELNPEEFEFIKENIDLYTEDGSIKTYIDTFIDKLNETVTKSEKQKKDAPLRDKARKSPQKKTVPPKASKKEVPETVEKVEHFTLEEKYLKRYLLLHNKTKTKSQILNFIKALQKAITEKLIRKTSKYANEINHIQTELIKLYNMDNLAEPFEITLDGSWFDKIKKIIDSKKVRLSVTYIKRFIGMFGGVTKEKAERLLNLINKAVGSGKITKSDPYFEKIKTVQKALNNYKNKEELAISESQLRGLAGAVGLEAPRYSQAKKFKDSDLVSSMDLKGMKFQTMGFRGSWKNMLGDPENPFHVMIYGAGGKGKSTFTVMFAKYLSQNLNLKTIYIADEEKVSKKLRDKIEMFDAYSPNFITTVEIPKSLRGFDVIVLDSVTSMGVRPERLEELQKKHPHLSIIYILQTNKQGRYYGHKKWEHLGDMVLKFEDGVMTVEKNRFGKTGEHKMDLWKHAKVS